MALTTNTQANAESICNIATGQVVSDSGSAADSVFQLGFKPRYIRWVNLTDRIVLEWYDGMAANSALRDVAAGTATLDVSSGITVGSGAGTSSENPSSFTIKAADIPASKVFVWLALG